MPQAAEILFKEGDRVWCALFGWGKVIRINPQDGDRFPVAVLMEASGNTEDYSRQGEYMSSAQRTLFFAEIVPGPSALVRPWQATLQPRDVVRIDPILPFPDAFEGTREPTVGFVRVESPDTVQVLSGCGTSTLRSYSKALYTITKLVPDVGAE